MQLPSLFPNFDPGTQELKDGSEIDACSFCRDAIENRPECRKYYGALAQRPEGYYQCPFGFTSRTFFVSGSLHVVTGVVAYPRFDTAKEREMAKRYPRVRISRKSVEAVVSAGRTLDELRARAVLEAAKVLPQAFHELRKLNGAVLQHAEKEIGERGESASLRSIQSAAELMRNNFDILEALSNIDGMKALPSDETVNVFDLLYKMKKILQERAAAKEMHVQLTGQRAIVRGSRKSFPIVPAVLLENAIKYGRRGSVIHADVSVQGDRAIMYVENVSDARIDPARCFQRGVRFSNDVEGGGFGLFLAREIVAAHNGSIACKPGANRVRMVVELPLLDVMPGY